MTLSAALRLDSTTSFAASATDLGGRVRSVRHELAATAR
jgi:hypothetical protein